MAKTLQAAILATLSLAMAGPAAHAGVRSPFSDSVFVMSNALTGNSVAMLKRTLSGDLRNLGTFSTGGVGSGAGAQSPADPLGSQDALKLSEDGRWLFAVNASSHQISTFRVLEDRLLLTSVVDSGGLFPNSIAVSGDLVYVLNALNDGSIAGFRLSRSGRLQPIPGSVRALNLATPSVGGQPNIMLSPADIAFSPDGDWLVLADKNFGGIGKLYAFKVGSDGGLAKTPVATDSPDPAPFGITFDRRGHLLVSETVFGALSSYELNDDGTLELISRSVLNGENRAPGATQPCWVDTTRKFALMTNTFSQDISTYRVNRRGELSLLNPSAVTVGPAAGNGLIDIAVSGDGRFANVLSGDTGVIRSFSINPITGALKLTATLKLFEGNTGMAGIVAD